MAVKSVKLTKHRIRQRVQDDLLIPSGEWTYIVEAESNDTSDDIDRYFASRPFDLPYYARIYRLTSPFANEARVTDMSFTRIDPTHWEVTATADVESSDKRPFSSEELRPREAETIDPQRESDFGIRDEIEVSAIPLNMPLTHAKFKGWYKNDKEFIEHPRMLLDYTLPVTNSLGVPYDPPAEHERYIAVIRLHYTQRGLSLFGASSFGPFLNSKKFSFSWPHLSFALNISEPFTVKMTYGSATYMQDARRWRQTVEFQIHPDSWLVKLLDQGYEEFDGTEGDFISGLDADRLRRKRVLNRSGNPVTSPVLLNGRARRVTDPKNDWVVGRWLPYGLLDFSRLRF